MSILEIEAAIEQLPAEQVDALMTWIERFRNELWDKQIANDLDSGRLDDLLSEVDKEYEAGLAKPL